MTHEAAPAPHHEITPTVLPQAVEVEHMTTVQLLVEPSCLHLLPAYDTNAITASQVFWCGIWEAIHTRRYLTEPQEVGNTVAEVTEGQIQVPDLQ